jgi:hypothetical protein
MAKISCADVFLVWMRAHCPVLQIGWIAIESSLVAFFRVLLAQLVVNKIAFREGAVAMANEHLEVRKTKSIS